MNLFPRSLAVLLPLSLLSLPMALTAEVKLPKCFTPHMVLQRDMAVPIWGTAAPGEKVTVKFRGQTKTVEAGKDGQWKVKLEALKAGGPDELEVNDKKITDVLVGEVWVGSGQSNMDMPVGAYIAGDPVLAENALKTYPKLRLLKKDGNAVWTEATPEQIKAFSAMLFSFGMPLQKELDVPVGLMVGAVGGTPSGLWLTEEMYKADDACAQVAKKFAETYDYEAVKSKFDTDFAAWKLAVEEAKKTNAKPPGVPQPVSPAGECNRGKTGQLYQQFIKPIEGYGIKGVLWDQGESGTAITGVDQYTLMGALIKGWRKAWGQGDFPFLYVQKPSGTGCAWDYENPVTAKANKFVPQPAAPPRDNGSYHELHLKIMQYPATTMVTSTDLGPGIHPVNKSGYGKRGSDMALKVAYGREGEFYGPLYASHKVEGNAVRIKYTHTGKGLAFKNGEKLQGFTIAGADKKFVWGEARIDGNDVVVSSPEVAAPVAVRYAWAGNYPWANLFNQDGLPAQPFHSDAWEAEATEVARLALKKKMEEAKKAGNGGAGAPASATAPPVK